MKRGLGFLLALFTLPACTLVSEGDISLTWSLTRDGQAVSCLDVGASELRVTARRSTGEDFVDRFSCSSLGGTTAPVPSGTYTVTIELLDNAGTRLNLVPVVTSGVRVVSDATTQLGNFPFDFTAPKGNISLSWSILVNGQASTCAAVGATSMQVVSSRAGGSQYIDLFDCDDMAATAADLPVGTYTVQINLLDAQSNRLNLVDVIETGVQVVANSTTSLGNFPFGFTIANGKATFTVHMGSAAVTGGNCNPTNPGNGAGVALQEIRVTSATQCMAYTITGVTDMNNAPTTAQTCQKFLCQLNNTVHTIGGLPSGNYVIQVLGYKGATSSQNAPLCYISDAMPFTVSGSGTTNIGQIFAPFDDSQDPQHLCNATKPLP